MGIRFVYLFMSGKRPWPLTTPCTSRPASSRTLSAFPPAGHRGTFSVPLRRCWGTTSHPSCLHKAIVPLLQRLSPRSCVGERWDEMHLSQKAATESQTFPPACSDIRSERFLKGYYWQIFVSMVPSLALHGKHSLPLLPLICKPETEIIYTRWFYGFLVYITTTQKLKNKKKNPSLDLISCQPPSPFSVPLCSKTFEPLSVATASLSPGPSLLIPTITWILYPHAPTPRHKKPCSWQNQWPSFPWLNPTVSPQPSVYEGPEFIASSSSLTSVRLFLGCQHSALSSSCSPASSAERPESSVTVSSHCLDNFIQSYDLKKCLMWEDTPKSTPPSRLFSQTPDWYITAYSAASLRFTNNLFEVVTPPAPTFTTPLTFLYCFLLHSIYQFLTYYLMYFITIARVSCLLPSQLKY